MNNIVENFPTAETIRVEDAMTYQLYLFEEELRSILRLILFAKTKGARNYTYVSELSAWTIDFLVDRGYTVDKTEKDAFGWKISW